MERKLKICFAVPQLTGGGAERVVSVLSSTLAEQGHDVAVIIYDRKENEYPTSDLVKKYYLCDEKYSKNSLGRRIQRIGYVRSFIKDNGYEYVVAFLKRAVTQTFLATRGLDIKFISTLRNNPYELPLEERIKTDFVTFFADAHFVQNQMQKDYYWKCIQKKTFALSNPVSNIFVDNKKEYNQQIRKIVSVGRLNPQKNFDLLINAMSDLIKEFPELKADIWGIGQEEERLSQVIKEKKLQGVVNLKGRTNAVKDVLNDADLFVMTSDYEGMPNSLLEAMTFGMPCVSTDCPTGPSDLIDDDVNGMLIPMGDIEKLVTDVKILINNPQKAIELGEKARATTIETHSSKAIADKFVEECIKI